MFSWSRCQSFLRGKTAITLHIQIHSFWFCHSDETGIFHNKSSRYSQNNTFWLVFFHNSKKRSLGKYLKEKPQMAGKEQNHIPVESTHMCKPLHAQHRQNIQSEYVLWCTQIWGGVQILLVKQRLQNSQNVWNPEASPIIHLPNHIKGTLCARVEVRSPLYILSFYFPNVLIQKIFHSSR